MGPQGAERAVRHLKVFGIAAAFGLGAYAVVRVLIYISREIGLLAWLAA